MLQFCRVEKIQDWEKELKRKNRRKRREERREALHKFIVEHPEIAIPMLAGLGLAAAKGIKSAAKTIQAIAEETSKSKRIYDHRLGKYHYLKRGLKQRELLEVTDRLNNGEKLVDILMSMNVLRG